MLIGAIAFGCGVSPVLQAPNSSCAVPTGAPYEVRTMLAWTEYSGPHLFRLSYPRVWAVAAEDVQSETRTLWGTTDRSSNDIVHYRLQNHLILIDIDISWVTVVAMRETPPYVCLGSLMVSSVGGTGSSLYASFPPRSSHPRGRVHDVTPPVLQDASCKQAKRSHRQPLHTSCTQPSWTCFGYTIP